MGSISSNDITFFGIIIIIAINIMISGFLGKCSIIVVSPRVINRI